MYLPRPKAQSWTENALTVAMWALACYVLLVAVITVLSAA
jgi:hypothetical protein